MYTVKIDGVKAIKMLNNVVKYSDGFIKETKAKQGYVASKLAGASIEGFYDFLDMTARTDPEMLHHIYEWREVGVPEARLVELKKITSGKNVLIESDFLMSFSIPEGGSEPFDQKAYIMENQIEVEPMAKDAKAMHFSWNGEEYFRTGPLVVVNPGGEATRDGFLKVFKVFYDTYLDNVYLNAIGFYDHFSDARRYSLNFNSAVSGTGAREKGRKTALSWVLSAPGEDYE